MENFWTFISSLTIPEEENFGSIPTHGGLVFKVPQATSMEIWCSIWIVCGHHILPKEGNVKQKPDILLPLLRFGQMIPPPLWLFFIYLCGIFLSCPSFKELQVVYMVHPHPPQSHQSFRRPIQSAFTPAYFFGTTHSDSFVWEIWTVKQLRLEGVCGRNSRPAIQYNPVNTAHILNFSSILNLGQKILKPWGKKNWSTSLLNSAV